jgi:hypothetical protein
VRLLSHSRWTRFFQQCKIVNRACECESVCVVCGQRNNRFSAGATGPPSRVSVSLFSFKCNSASKLNERTFSVGGVHQSCRA